MRKAIAILTQGIQVALTSIIMACIYMVFAILDSNFGVDGLFGLLLVQPIMAVILSGLTVLASLIVGLPLRLNKKLNRWWTTNFYIPIIGTICGLAFLLFALLPAFRDTVLYELDGKPTLKQIPNSIFSFTGWLLTAFSVLHIYPPRQVTEMLLATFKLKKLKGGI